MTIEEQDLAATLERCCRVLEIAEQGVVSCHQAVDRARRTIDERGRRGAMPHPRESRHLGEMEHQLRVAVDRCDHAAAVVRFLTDAKIAATS